MTIKSYSIKDISLRYRSPEIKVIEAKVQGVLCLSPMKENDFGDGGFGNDYFGNDY